MFSPTLLPMDREGFDSLSDSSDDETLSLASCLAGQCVGQKRSREEEASDVDDPKHPDRFLEDLIKSPYPLSFGRVMWEDSIPAAGEQALHPDRHIELIPGLLQRPPSTLSLCRSVSSIRPSDPSMLSHGRGSASLDDLLEVSARCMDVLQREGNSPELAEVLSSKLQDISNALARKASDPCDLHRWPPSLVQFPLAAQESEILNLQSVLKQLSETRAEAMNAKANMLESYNKLQTDFGK